MIRSRNNAAATILWRSKRRAPKWKKCPAPPPSNSARRAYGAMPLIVLTRTDYETGMPPEFTDEDKQAMRLVWESMHAEMAALSNKSQQRFVAGAGHYIQRDAPDAVIQAVADVVAAARDMAR